MLPKLAKYLLWQITVLWSLLESVGYSLVVHLRVGHWTSVACVRREQCCTLSHMNSMELLAGVTDYPVFVVGVTRLFRPSLPPAPAQELLVPLMLHPLGMLRLAVMDTQWG